ncbi:SixA phosphatase family protein [Marinigracilibium pacificum]|uniref:Histidine phosphatase family protein n=1 Tax=Marinigracilibium pacificum TaxID=2729599 RepID=A0A848JAI3_9BACT|nr:histidine phosphatase family protein [Marinigracilibium pacificum]NMM50052.1 histidine phosphatase family protein [Marinigracilibium pacificum]
MKKLVLIRHGQAQEASSDEKDIDRILTGKGFADVNRLGRVLASKSLTPDVIVSSNAERAALTSNIIAEGVKYDINQIRHNDVLYNASVRNMLDVVNSFREAWKTVFVIGHNPSLSYLAEYLSNAEIGNVSPGGAVVLRAEVEFWNEISQNTMYFEQYYSPDTIPNI